MSSVPGSPSPTDPTDDLADRLQQAGCSYGAAQMLAHDLMADRRSLESQLAESQQENQRLRENWADLADRAEKATHELHALSHRRGYERAADKASGVALVRDYMRGYS